MEPTQNRIHPFWETKADYYILSVDLGSHSDERAGRALELLWEHPAVRGPFEFSDRPPSEQPVWTAATRHLGRRYRGTVRLGSHEAIPFGAVVHRLDGVAYDVFALYIGSDILARIYPEIPDPTAPQPWYAEANAVLVNIAHRIQAHLKCSRALIGWELLVFEDHLLKSIPVLFEKDGVLQWRPPDPI